MLDRQINLFMVDTSAFLHDEEKETRTKYLELEKQKKELKNEDVTKVKQQISSLSDEIKKEKKIAKQKLLKLVADAVKYNNEHEEKRIRKLDERYLW